MRFDPASLQVKEDLGHELIVVANDHEYFRHRASLKQRRRTDIIIRSVGMSTTGLRVRRVTVSSTIGRRLPEDVTEADFDRWFNEQVRTRLLKNAEIVMTK